MNVVERDSFLKVLESRAVKFLDRWIFGSQWANVWGDGAVLNFQNFATELNTLFVNLLECRSNSFLSTVDNAIGQMMGRISIKANEQINNAVVRDRKRVYVYYSLLWVWHRLDNKRWEYSSIPMRTGRKRTSKLEVDHTVADAWWARLINKEIDKKLANFIGSDEEKALVAPDEFETRLDAFAFINLLGNCSLLDKSFNISKNDKPMWGFLQDVHEFKEGLISRTEWETSLLLPQTITDPNGSTLAEIMLAIQSRDSFIRKDLIDFIAGNKLRVD